MKTESHPKALYLLSSIQLWERFSFYGMRILLILFLIDHLHFSDHNAYTLYGVYTALVEMGALFGGWIADRYLGNRRAIVYGALSILLGHLTLGVDTTPPYLQIGLGLIVMGTALFTPNIRTLLGECYPTNSPLREKGFTLFYIAMNFGGILAALLCSSVARQYGWSFGFGLAAFGMFLGILQLPVLFRFLPLNQNLPSSPVLKKHLKEGLAGIAMGGLCFFALTFSKTALPYLPFICILGIAMVIKKCTQTPQFPKQSIKKLCLLVFLYFLFSVFEEQMFSTFTVYMQRNLQIILLGFEISPSSLLTANPLAILLLGPLLLKWNGSKSRFSLLQSSLAFALLGSAFLMVFLGSLGVLLAFIMIALGELLLIPPIYAYITEVTPSLLKGRVMGAIMLAHGLSFAMSGYLSQFFALTTAELESMSQNELLNFYHMNFFYLSIIPLAVCQLIILYSSRYRIKILTNKLRL